MSLEPRRIGHLRDPFLRQTAESDATTEQRPRHSSVRVRVAPLRDEFLKCPLESLLRLKIPDAGAQAFVGVPYSRPLAHIEA